MNSRLHRCWWRMLVTAATFKRCHSDRKSVNKSKNCQQFQVTNFSVLTCFEIIFSTLVNLHSNSGSFVPKLEVNLEINLGTFKFTTSMFNYGQHSIIWIIEIDHRTSLFLIQIFIRSWQNKTWRELLFTVMIIWRWKEFSEKLQKLNGSSHYFHSLIVRRRPGGP